MLELLSSAPFPYIIFSPRILHRVRNNHNGRSNRDTLNPWGGISNKVALKIRQPPLAYSLCRDNVNSGRTRAEVSGQIADTCFDVEDTVSHRRYKAYGRFYRVCGSGHRLPSVWTICSFGNIAPDFVFLRRCAYRAYCRKYRRTPL